MTQREYWDEVCAIAESIKEELGSDEDLRERLDETIDGHQWVIYTSYNYDILRFSANAGYMVDNFGAEGLVNDGVLNTTALAFWALHADVSDKLGT